MSIYSLSHNQKTFEDRNTSLFKITNNISEKAKTVLDVGCSSGYLGQYLKINKNILVDGIEVNESDRKTAKKYLDNVYDINISNVKELNKFYKKYDAIIFADVLEHIINPEIALKNFTKNLNENGQILISVPNITHQSVVLELLAFQWNYEESGILDKTHLHFFDYNGIIKLVENSGLYIEKIDFSIVDIPDQKILDDLSKMNFQASEKKLLLKILNRPQHKIFQYIILATNKKPQRYQSFLKKQTIFKPVKDWINYWEQTLDKYKNTERISHELNEIKNSYLFKLWPIYNKIKYGYKKVKYILGKH